MAQHRRGGNAGHDEHTETKDACQVFCIYLVINEENGRMWNKNRNISGIFLEYFTNRTENEKKWRYERRK